MSSQPPPSTPESAKREAPLSEPFIGRERELWELQRLLREHPVVTIYGLAGQGKSALVRELANWSRQTGAFNQVVLNQVPSIDGITILDETCRELGLPLDPFTSFDECVSRLRRHVSASSCLIIWDSFDRMPRELAGALFEPSKAPGVSRSRLVLVRTGAEPDWHKPVDPTWYYLSGFNSEDAKLYLHHLLRQIGQPEKIPEISTMVLNRSAGHPRTLAEAAFAVACPNDETRPTADALRARGSGSPELAALLESNPDSRWLLTLLSLITGHVSRPVAGMIMDSLPYKSRASGWRLFDQLVKYGLLSQSTISMPTHFILSLAVQEVLSPEIANFGEESPVGVIHVHPMLTQFARQTISPNSNPDIAVAYCSVYRVLAQHLALWNSREPHLTESLLEIEWLNLQLAVELALDAGRYDDAVFIVDHLSVPLLSLNRAQDERHLRELITAALDTSSANQSLLCTPKLRAAFLEGEALHRQGRYEESIEHYTSILALLDTSAIDTPSPETLQVRGAVHQALGIALGHRNDLAGAQEHLTTSAELFERMRNLGVTAHAEASNHLALATLHRKQGRLDEAANHLQMAQDVSRQFQDYSALAVIQMELAEITQDPAESRRMLAQSLRYFENVGDLEQASRAHHNLGVLLQRGATAAIGSERSTYLAEAESHFHISLKHSEKIGRLDGMAEAAHHLGILAKQASRWEEANQWFDRAIRSDEARGCASEVAYGYHELARLRLAAARQEVSVSVEHRIGWLEQSLDIQSHAIQFARDHNLPNTVPLEQLRSEVLELLAVLRKQMDVQHGASSQE